MKEKYRNNKTTFIALGGLFGVTLLSGTVLKSTIVRADVEDEVTITVSQSCTMTGNVTSAHTKTIANGQYDSTIGETAVNVTCNDNAGFAVYAIGYTDNTLGNNVLTSSTLGSTHDIATGTLTSGANSQWAMKLVPDSASSPAYPLIIAGSSADTLKAQGDPDFSSFQEVPSSYTKVAYRTTGTDTGTGATGANFTTTYQAYISPTQAAGTYTGKVKYVLVHPNTAPAPLQPQQATAGCINYFANASDAVGTMGCQSASDNATVTLLASNFSRTGYGFAGWSDAYDYATNQNAHFYGPQEDITVPEGTTASGLSLYAVWVKSVGSLQDSSKVSQLCGTGTGSLTAATYDNEGDEDESTWSINAGLSSVSALTDTRDNQTYAIAKLADGKCWMIENLRLDNTAELTTLNTNNPLNDGTNVTLKHNYTDTDTHNTLSATSSVAYNATTAPDGWCDSDSAACDDQSRLRTDSTANRATNNPNSNSTAMYSYGNYYNWYSATAGNGTYSKSSGTTAGDLCPAGWHLPTGFGSGEFGLLSNSLGGYKDASNVARDMTSSTTPTAAIMSKRFRHFPNNVLYSGYILGGSLLSSRGSYGHYWSSTAKDRVNAYYLYLSSSRVGPGTLGYSKYGGGSLRCIAGS